MPSRRAALAFGLGFGLAPLAAGSQALDLARLRVGTGLDDSSKPVLYAQDADAAIVVRSGAPIRTARDLNGKTVGVTSLVTIQLLATRAWIDGGDSQSVRFLEISPAATQAALDQARIDAATVLDPILSQLTAAVSVRVLVYPGAVATRFKSGARHLREDRPRRVGAYEPYRAAAYLDGAQIQPLIDQAARYKFITKPFPAAELISNYALKRRR